MSESANQFTPSRKHTGEFQNNLCGVLDNDDASMKHGIALLLVDVINDLDFEGNEFILQEAAKIANNLKDLKDKCRQNKIPIIYANDNFGKWRSDINEICRYVTEEGTSGSEMAKLLKPTKEDYFVTKPKHSAFFGSTLPVLLQHLKIKTLIICGFAGNVCVCEFGKGGLNFYLLFLYLYFRP